MTNILYISTLILLLACNKKREIKNDSVNNTSIGNAIETIDNCDNALSRLIKNSTLESPFKEKAETSIDNEENGKITVKLYVKSNGGENQENTVGWIIIDLNNNTLLDITNDIENPDPLRYNIGDYKKFIECHKINIKNTGMENKKVEFENLFNEESKITFSPEELKNNELLNKNFKDNLKLFEEQHKTEEDFDSQNLSKIINNEVFANSDSFIDSSWLNYFIKKYGFDVKNLSQIFDLSIEQEDLGAINIFIANKYIVSLNQVKKANEVKTYADKLKKFNLQNKGLKDDGDPTFYISEKSKINQIVDLLTSKYKSNKIYDKDGYTNLREDNNTNSSIIEKITSGEYIEVLENPEEEDWYLIQTKDGKKGYVHKSRIVSE